jgi:hypothetical protein
MRKFIRTSVLVLALAVPAFAGYIPYGAAPPPPPPTQITEGGGTPNNVTLSGEIPNGITGEIPNGVTDEIPYGATFINALLSLF